ncbi:Predicted acetyltransferase [Micromonospora echinaurantiaca]|uniref:Predicted acetyltransferase n=1 Tax=Micromonospora echinaurantiaca TaxID=47857 RepID=A0A1C5HBB8_9ACTN|nr:GNAT family N-acetyltransferase [Micromonospora echinaurantiaca]SCG43260.1 Predicted acetyltransferase [Micromonospora echinaurantiaca]
MPALTPPTERVQASFLAAMAEFQAEGRGDRQDHTMVGTEIRRYAATWHRPEAFARYVADLRAQALPDTPRPAGWAPDTTLWWVDGDEYLGRISVRHRLTPQLREVGGHIGYDVRPTARRRGHATAMLRAALPVAHRLAIDPALVTCDVDNLASRRVIERNGGVLADERAGKLRFWVPTGRP